MSSRSPESPRSARGGRPERTRGLYRFLGSGAAYDRWQRLLGGEVARKRVVRELIRPTPHAHILEVGCGTAEYVAHLPPGVRYVGLDANPRYIAAAGQRFGARGRFVCAEAGKTPVDAVGEEFDIVLAMGLLHHLNDAEAAAVVDLAHRVLRSRGRLVTLDAVFHHGQGAVSRLLVACDRGAHVRRPEAYRALVASRFQEIETHLVTNLLAVPYSHFLMSATRTE